MRGLRSVGCGRFGTRPHVIVRPRFRAVRRAEGIVWSIPGEFGFHHRGDGTEGGATGSASFSLEGTGAGIEGGERSSFNGKIVREFGSPRSRRAERVGGQRMGNAPSTTSRNSATRPRHELRAPVRKTPTSRNQPQLPEQTLNLKVTGSIPVRPIVDARYCAGDVAGERGDRCGESCKRWATATSRWVGLSTLTWTLHDPSSSRRRRRRHRRRSRHDTRGLLEAWTTSRSARKVIPDWRIAWSSVCTSAASAEQAESRRISTTSWSGPSDGRKVVRFESIRERAEALEAAGLSE